MTAFHLAGANYYAIEKRAEEGEMRCREDDNAADSNTKYTNYLCANMRTRRGD